MLRMHPEVDNEDGSTICLYKSMPYKIEIMVLKTKVILRFQGAFPTKIYFNTGTLIEFTVHTCIIIFIMHTLFQQTRANV